MKKERIDKIVITQADGTEYVCERMGTGSLEDVTGGTPTQMFKLTTQHGQGADNENDLLADIARGLLTR